MAQFRWLGRVVLLAAMTAIIGCNSKDSPAMSPGSGAGPGMEKGGDLEPSGPHAAGMKVFNTNNCGRCHTINGVGGGGKGKMQGPDLGKVAADPAHTPEWFGEFIRDPKATKPKSRMPAFQGKINDDDFKALIEYLSSLK
jgi:mono/diheme cytochrome c family protein